MYNPDENHIDRLSREAAEHYHAPGKPAWDALRQTLDKELPLEKEKKRRGFLLFFLLGLGLLVAGSGIYFGTRSNKNIIIAGKETQKKQNSLPSNTVSTENNPSTKKDNNSTKAGTGTSTSSTIESSNTQKVAADKLLTKNAQQTMVAKDLPAASSALKIAGTNRATKHSVVVQKDQKIARGIGAVNSQRSTLHKKQNQLQAEDVAFSSGKENTKNSYGHKHSSIKNKNTTEEIAKQGNDIETTGTGKDIANNSNDVNNKGTESSPAPMVADAKNNKTTAPKVDAAAIKPVTENKDSSKAIATKTKSKSKNERAILLGLTAGMDLSTVKFTYASSAGYNFGFMGGYQFSKHWSVYTGLVYTKKNYKLNGDDYHPPKNYFTNQPGVYLNSVDGYCRMWDVPLLARYTFNPSSKTAFFASAGLSSYFMKKQNYNYVYWAAGMQTSAAWSDNDNFNHYFSILDISGGLQRSMGKHMNWQIEPYAKIPLGGVGFGNIRLSSFGINLTVQYKQPVKR